MLTCTYCGERLDPDDLDRSWHHWIQTGHHIGDDPPEDAAAPRKQECDDATSVNERTGT